MYGFVLGDVVEPHTSPEIERLKYIQKKEGEYIGYLIIQELTHPPAVPGKRV